MPRMVGRISGLRTSHCAGGRSAILRPFLVLFRNLLGGIPRLIFDEAKVRKLPSPFLAFFVGAFLLMNNAIKRISYIFHFAPRPNTDVFGVAEELCHVLMVPVFRGRAMILRRTELIQLPCDPPYGSAFFHEPVENTADPGG